MAFTVRIHTPQAKITVLHEIPEFNDHNPLMPPSGYTLHFSHANSNILSSIVCILE